MPNFGISVYSNLPWIQFQAISAFFSVSATATCKLEPFIRRYNIR